MIEPSIDYGLSVDHLFDPLGFIYVLLACSIRQISPVGVIQFLAPKTCIASYSSMLGVLKSSFMSLEYYSGSSTVAALAS
ncbi:hypothetical protein Nepgr_021799 [Nepenthes gracilis]|uniref:Uncharacterized protein n=1 Tax=Nepenthes gracilis TaxID=150966 RepID=A0AAD3SZ43_NEPGR|nr:hypothetical protein Nepgr_021799 [Nepenthes gracilis]